MKAFSEAGLQVTERIDALHAALHMYPQALVSMRKHVQKIRSAHMRAHTCLGWLQADRSDPAAMAKAATMDWANEVRSHCAVISLRGTQNTCD